MNNHLLILKIDFQIEKKLLVLLNPYSGEKRTRSVYNFQILPILDLINFKIDVIGKSFLMKKNLVKYIYFANSGLF